MAAVREETLLEIERLLRREHREEGWRGLFDDDQLQLIRQGLREIAAAAPPLPSDAPTGPLFDERSALCIAYPDHVAPDSGERTAAARLIALFNEYLSPLFSHLHVLPHFPCPRIHDHVEGAPSRADGGFEPLNYRMDPAYGTPEELRAADASLMFDFVVNHLSAAGDWFQGFLADDPDYRGYFVELSPAELEALDLTPVFRPRPHHPVVAHRAPDGTERLIWCTFSRTQVDINIRTPAVFLAVMRALVEDFIAEGAQWIRLDAIGYLVKSLGFDDTPATSCFGIEETHAVVQAMNAFLRDVSPETALIAEVNATAGVIATYYGDGENEAHVAYDFPSAPISLYSIYSEDAGAAHAWARERAQHPDRIGLSFNSSHDGIGVLPMADVAPRPDGTPALDFFLAELTRRGAGINQKSKVVGGETRLVPYEACITWAQAILTPEERDALVGDTLSNNAVDLIASRFIASQSLVLAAPHSIPADYLGTLATLLNDDATTAKTEHNRDRNRGQVDGDWFGRALASPQTAHERLFAAVFRRKLELYRARQNSPAFSPHARCEVDVLTGHPSGEQPVFSVLRSFGDERLLAMTNCTPAPVEIALSPDIPLDGAPRSLLDSSHEYAGGHAFRLAPYAVSWWRLPSGH